MINPNKLGRSPFPRWQAQWMMVGLRGGAVTPPGLSDGDPVSSWTDSSGNGHTATQTGTARPTFKSNIVNGKPVVRFLASSLTSLNVTSPPSGVSPWTVFVVSKVAASALLITIGEPVTARPVGPLFSDTDGNFYTANRSSYSAASNAFTGAFHVFSVESNGTGIPLNWVDGTSQSVSGGASAGAGNWTQIGSNASNGDIAEIILYNADLGSTDRANIEKYLGTKYGITVAGGSAVQPDSVTGLQGWWKADSLGS